ncbi:NAD-dependent deacetylase [Sulfurimonas sp. SAG-AH-194-C20]|nr:Sir2 family NAD-dependent protein deacetylase [Sulfurimonas sp. SAG-AH-194-C20]MDF1878425.1 NAD-dependent deacetylase [Sulfurimonas sp. SAG-AH-194-C20]
MYIPKRDKSGAPKIIIFSGAGLDAPSGIKTFRDTDGLWNEHKIEDVCTQSTWKKNFELVHEFYNARRNDLKNAMPNHAHKIIAKITEKYGKDTVLNITMNVSDLQERVGIECLHVHGELTKMECEACGATWDIGYKSFDINTEKCPKCESLKGVRPKIVFFGGRAPLYSYMLRAFEYALHPDSIIIIIGTQGNVVNIENNLISTPCKKILCNMEASTDIDCKKIGFNKVYYESIETAIEKIEANIFQWWKD